MSGLKNSWVTGWGMVTIYSLRKEFYYSTSSSSESIGGMLLFLSDDNTMVYWMGCLDML